MTTDRRDHRHPVHTVVITSGGLNSTVLAYWLAARHSRLTLISFTHGQRLRSELDHAVDIAALLNSTHQIIDLTSMNALFTGSTADAMPRNGNAIMLDIAVAVAITVGADAVAFGAHARNRTTCFDDLMFVERLSRNAPVATKGLRRPGFRILAPFLTLAKADVVRLGQALAVPFARTWSCHRDQETHCGTCKTCVERQEAFRHNDIVDPTVYRTTLSSTV